MALPRPGRVLITRPQPGASETERLVAALGLVPLVAPLQEIVTVPISLPAPERLAGLVLTSGNAITPIPPAYHELPSWVVGDATAARAEDAGFKDVRSANGDAIALARLIADRMHPTDGPLLLVTGRGHGAPLCALLREHTFRVIRRVAYRPRAVTCFPPAVAEALADPEPLRVLFYSAVAARLFTRLLKAAGKEATIRTHEAVAISPAVGMALETHRWGAIRVAARPNQDAMLILLR